MLVEPAPSGAASRPQDGGVPLLLHAGRQHARRVRTVDVVVGVAVVGAVFVGLYCRLWLIFHSPSSSDADVVGLMARAALHGHFNAFFGGQDYGGTAETDVIAVAFFFFGQSSVVAEIVLAVFAAVAGLLTWRIALRLVPSKLALLAGALAWAAPADTIRNSVRVGGFRGVTLACGLGMLLIILRIRERRPGLAGFALLGLLAGVGWWSSPEIAYYLAPTALLLGIAMVRAPQWRSWLPGLFTTLSAAIVGALPWIWANVGSGFASLHRNGPVKFTYVGRLELFFQYVFPMETGQRVADSGRWVLGSLHLIGLVLVVAALVFSVAACLARGGAPTVIGLALLALPFLYAMSPASWAWADGRYGSYLVPLLALVLTVGADEIGFLVGRGSFAQVLMSGVVVLCAILAAVGVEQIVNLHKQGYTSGWGDPDAPAIAAVSKLRAAGITTGYADYWVAYRLDFLSRGTLDITTVGGDIDRLPTINSVVERSGHNAWLFVPLREAKIDGTQFSAPHLTVGPDIGVPESTFVGRLRQLGIGYRSVDTGLVVAVVPDRPVTPYQAEMPDVGPP